MEDSHPLRQMMRFVTKILWFRSLDENRYVGCKSKSDDYFDFIFEPDTLKEFEGFLYAAGVEDNLTVKKDTDGKRRLYFDTETQLPFFRVASSGTKALYSFFYWCKTSQDASFILIDEFDIFFEYMRDAGFEDFERGERGSTAQHLSVTEFKVKKETERLENLQSSAQVIEEKLEQLSEQEEAATEKADAAQERVEHLVPKMQKVEELARAFTNDAGQVLPPPDKLESAKSYREKKAMPIFHKIIGVLRNVFSRYLDLKYEYERLQERYRMYWSARPWRNSKRGSNAGAMIGMPDIN